MGLDIHSFNFLLYARSKLEFRETVMLGRQENHLPCSFVNEKLGRQPAEDDNRYSEWIFEDIFGASPVASLDHSDYEGATYLADMSANLPTSLIGRFDTVFDGGVSEHIYNIPQALKNISCLCRSGGQIIHVLPANNFCGHGFWQFSPELFFSLYSEKNGYRDTEVFLADLSDINRWYRVKKPSAGKRTSSLSSGPMYILVRTVVQVNDFSATNVQQSDYIHAWEKSAGSEIRQTSPENRTKKTLQERVRGAFLPKAIRRRQERSLTKWNPWLEPMIVPTFKL